MDNEGTEYIDVLIVGAGLSGVAAAYYVQSQLPYKSYTILEARDAIGGTWDLFRYPGVRSDSDMYTLGYTFRPWTNPKAIADGASILSYVRETASEYGIDKQIRFRHRMCRASWSSEQALWTVDVEQGHERIPVRFTCRFLFMCTGYYEYAQGYTPAFPGFDRFKGKIIHPQQWPKDFDYTDKKVVVIGSGATAVTLVPAMASKAAHVTMLQRSPTYILNVPAEDQLANWMNRHLPTRISYSITRWRQILMSMLLYRLTRWFPETMKRRIVEQVHSHLNHNYDVGKHFTPSYNPWDQRLCLVPDADLFNAINDGKASVATDHIEEFTETGIRLKSGTEMDADVVITATGLVLKLMDNIEFLVDGQKVDFTKALSYKGMMFSGVPNLAMAFGYTNASWTLKCELTAQYVCRLLRHMDMRGYRVASPHNRNTTTERLPLVNFTSGYVQRALDNLPSQGTKHPWRVYQNYLMDMLVMRFSTIQDKVMELR
ncbi:MAG: NAD(P)/FAD-dependent oxidoreductase [Chloroflexota bacterium]